MNPKKQHDPLFSALIFGLLPLAVFSALATESASDVSAPHYAARCATTSAPVEADYVMTNARVFTANEAQPWAEAVAIKGRTIVYVGDNEGAAAYRGEHTQALDAGGRLVLPGFIDAHIHPLLAAVIGAGIAIRDNSSLDAVVRQIETHIDAHPGKAAYFGFGWDNNLFPPEGPTREILDAIEPDRPVLLISNDGHAGWMNTAAIEKAGITKDFPDPVPGISEFVRDAEGHPTGAIKETASILVLNKLSMIAPEDIRDGATPVFDALTRCGVTTVFDAGTFYLIDESYRMLDDLLKDERLPVRYFGSVVISAAPDAPGALRHLADLSQRYRSDRLRVNTLKFLTDGTVETRKASFFDPYLDTGTSADITLPRDLYRETARAAAAKGFDLHIHAIGDRAVYEALQTAQAVREAGHPDTRITICHVQSWRDQDRPAFKDTGVFVNFTGSWIYPDERIAKVLNKGRYDTQFRYKSLCDDGVTVTQGSDFPTADTINPLVNIEMSVTRRPSAQDAGEPALGPADEAMPVDLAVKTYTLNVARQLGLDHLIGSIETGKYADLIVLSKDIFNEPASRIDEAVPQWVMMDGRVRLDELRNEQPVIPVFDPDDDAMKFEEILP